MKNGVFWDTKPQFLLQRRHITSTLQGPSQLMLCKISGFHGCDYVECRLLGYKNPVSTSQETLRIRYRAQPVKCYVRFEVFTAVTMKNVCVLGCYAVWLL
jgi:hypothetical protein